MSVAPHSGIIDFGTFTSPTVSQNGIQGEVPAPLAGQGNYVLTADGWVPIASLGTLVYQGTWDASTNTPTLTSSVGTQGYYYVVSVAGNTDLNGITTWTVGDWALFNGSVWQKLEGGSTVDITGGQINNTVIGNNTPAAGSFTTLTAQTEVLKGTGQNLLLQSQAFTTASWARPQVTVVDNSTTAPDGTTTAASFISVAAQTGYTIASTSFVSGITYTQSLYVKPNGRTSFLLLAQSNMFSDATARVATFTLTGSGTVASVTGSGATASISVASNGFYRISITFTPSVTISSGVQNRDGAVGDGSTGFYIWGAQLELGSTLNTYIPTTTTAIYGTPSLSFSGVAGIGLESNGSLYHQPAGTGAVQAQATTSTATGGNARGANAVDWQMSRGAASQVASGTNSFIGGGGQNTASGSYATVVGGVANLNNSAYSFIGSGYSNNVNGNLSFVGTGNANTAGGFLNFIGGGYGNSATANAAVTTQATTTVTSGSTAVTLSGSNANIKVGQLVAGTGMPIYPHTYVAAISGTSLTLSQAANASGSPTLTFYTPHGVVVGGGNNQATGSYSFIGGGGDAGTSANRNTASGAWSTVGGGAKNTASGDGAFVGGGGFYTSGFSGNTASGVCSFISGGLANAATGYGSSAIGSSNTSSGTYSTVIGYGGVGRTLVGNITLAACNAPLTSPGGASQASILVLAKETTDATATVLCSNSAAASTVNQVIMPNNSAYYFKGSVIANVTGAANGAAWSFEGAIMRGANAASTVLIGTPVLNRVAASAGATAWVIALTADTTNGGLKVTVTGAAATTIRWVAKVETTEVTF